MLELTHCIYEVDDAGTRCGAPAEITDRFAMESTDGPLEHVTAVCIAPERHRITCDLGRFATDTARPSVSPTPEPLPGQ